MEATDKVTVLAVIPADEDYISLHHIFSHSNWRIDRVRTFGETAVLLLEKQAPVIVCSAELPDGDWKTVLSEAARYRIPPRVIVVSRAADDQLWGEVLDHGGYDVLATPFDAGEVVRVISLAWRQWKYDRQQLRSQAPDEAANTPNVRRVTGP